MPYADEEKQREYDRERKRRQRAAARSGEESVPSSVPPEPPIAETERRLEERASQEPAPAAVAVLEPPETTSNLHVIEDPYEVSQRTRELLDTQGWAVWTCTKLDDEHLVVIRDTFVIGYPEDIPAYTEEELYRLCELAPDHMRYINNLKKMNPNSRYLKTIWRNGHE